MKRMMTTEFAHPFQCCFLRAEVCGARRTCRDWTMAQRLRFATKAPLFDHAHIDTPRKWIAQRTSSTVLGRPCSLEPAAFLDVADIVSRVCSRVCCDTWWRSLPLLHSPYQSAIQLRWSGNPTPSRRHVQHHPQHSLRSFPMYRDTAAWPSIVCSRHSAPVRATPRQTSARVPPWKKWAAVWCTRTRQTCSWNSSKKRTTSPSCLSMKCRSQRMRTRRRPSQI